MAQSLPVPEETTALPSPEPFADRGAVEALVYIVLAEATRPLTTMEIAAALRRPFTTIRRRTHDLTEDGLLERHRDPTDGRRLRYAVPE